MTSSSSIMDQRMGLFKSHLQCAEGYTVKEPLNRLGLCAV